MKKRSVLLDYISKYKITYIVIISLFFVGVSIGVIYINMSNEEKTQNLTIYVNNIIDNIKNSNEIKEPNLLMNSIWQNSKNISIIWFLGCTIIGSYFVYVAILYNGFKIGYTVSTFIYILGTKKGVILSLSSLLLQNIIYIPVIFLIAESSIKMCKQNYKNINNIKREFVRHFIILLICLLLGIGASFVEVYFSTKLLKVFKEIF